MIETRMSRRGLLGAGLSLTFAFTMKAVPGSASARSGAILNAWITIHGDGRMDIVSPAAEAGNGSFTALPLILCEELEGDWSKVNPVAPMGTHPTLYGNPAFGGLLYTAGSTAVEHYFTPLRLAGAQARLVLLIAAAKAWSVPVAELTTRKGEILHAASGRQLPYAAAIALVDVEAPLPTMQASDLKPIDRFTLIGEDVGRVELPAKVTGTATYGMDVRLPGMLYASVLQCPYHGGKPQPFDSAPAKKSTGVVDVIALPNGVAVVAETIEAARAGRDQLEVSWTDAPATRLNSAGLHDAYALVAEDHARTGYVWDEAGTVESVLDASKKKFVRSYRTQALCHMQMEPINATAVISDDGLSVDVYCGSQSMSKGINAVAAATGFSRENVRFHQQFLGGGFGRRTQHEAAVDAVLIAKAVRRPVKLIWSREDDVGGARFFPALLHREEAALDPAGNILVWHQRIVGDSVLHFIQPGLLEESGKESVLMKTTELQGYTVPHRRAEFLWEKHHSRLATYRGVGAAPNRFAIESFVDEIAHATGRDAVEYRLTLAREDPRAQGVIRAVAEMSGWGRKSPANTGLGVAYGNKDGTYCAAVAEVKVDRESGALRILRVWSAIDCGIAVQPRNIVAQTTGGIIFAMGRTLMEELTIENGAVTQSNYHDYPVPRLSDMPEIEVRVMESDAPPSGAGEDGACVLPGAVANALFAATAARVRELPLTPERVLAHLS